MKTLVLVVLLCGAALAQDHAPLPEQCDADAKRWYASSSQNDELPYATLQKRSREMMRCSLGTSSPSGSRYFGAVELMYQATEAARLENYLRRHDLTKEFLAEDVAGKR